MKKRWQAKWTEITWDGKVTFHGSPEALGEYRASDTGNADNGDSNCQYKQHPARYEVAAILGAFGEKESN